MGIATRRATRCRPTSIRLPFTRRTTARALYEWEYRQHYLWRRTGRGGGKYYALWKDDRGKLQKRSLDTADTAEAQDRLVDFALRNGRFKAETTNGLTVRELVQHHYETYGRQLVSAEQEYHRSQILIARLGDLRLDQLSRRVQENFVADLRGHPYSQGYIADILSTLRRGINLARREELAELVRIIPVKRTRSRVAPVLTVEQLAQMWAAAENSFHGSMYMILALGTAARPAAILDLTRDRVREDLCTVQLLTHGKEQTNKRRPTVPLGHVRQCGGNCGVAEAATDHAASVESRSGTASVRSGVSSLIASVCM